MEFDKESNTFRFEPNETRIVAMDTCDLRTSGVVLGLLVDLRNAASSADSTHLPTPQDQRTFNEQQAARISIIDGMIKFITPFAEQQIHEEAAQFLSEQ